MYIKIYDIMSCDVVATGDSPVHYNRCVILMYRVILQVCSFILPFNHVLFYSNYDSVGRFGYVDVTK